MTGLLALSGIFILVLLVCYLDARFGWQFAAWLNGQASSPFYSMNVPVQQDEQIRALQKRVSVLEALVTDQSYELSQKINRL